MKYYLTLLLVLPMVACGSATAPISPPTSTAQVLIGSPPNDQARGTFASALKQDRLADIRKTLWEDAPNTAFVPTNAAFEAYFEARGITKEAFLASSELPEFIRTYIAPGNYYPKTFFETDDLTLTNLNGDLLTISRQGSDFFVNNVLIDGPILRDTEKVETGAIYYLSGVIEP